MKTTILKSLVAGIFLFFGFMLGYLALFAALDWTNISTVTSETPLTSTLWNDAMNTIKGNVQDLENRMTGKIGGIQVFSSPGTFNFTVPENISKIKVIVTGGGASGTSGGNNFGGGAGGTCIKYISVTPGQVISLTVGAGGIVTGPRNSGIIGTNSSFGTYCIGNGGGYNESYSYISGGASGGDINIAGGSGDQWAGYDVNPGTGTRIGNGIGGNSYWAGGASNYGKYYGNAGSNGGGGSGGQYTGGSGGNGIITVEW